MNTQRTRPIITEREQMRAHLEVLTQENDALKALVDMQFQRMYGYPRSTLSTGTRAERQAQLAAFP